MTYETLKVDDGQLISVLTVARREGAVVVVHGELLLHHLAHGGARAGGPEGAVIPHAPPRLQAVEREGTHRAITMSEIVDVPTRRDRTSPGSARCGNGPAALRDRGDAWRPRRCPPGARDVLGILLRRAWRLSRTLGPLRD
jgi:hypothetical protein